MPTDVGYGGDVGSIMARLGIDRAQRVRDDAFEDLSSGQKYQRAEENPAAVALALALQAQQGGMQGGIKNASEGVARSWPFPPPDSLMTGLPRGTPRPLDGLGRDTATRWRP